MRFITDFADQAVILPLATVVGMIFLSLGWVRGAAAWAFAVAGTLAMMLMLKLCMLACGWRWPELDIHSPSGHTASAAVVYGGLLSLALPRANPLARAALILVPTVVIAITRVMLGAHSVAEVISGGAVGFFGAWVMFGLVGARPQTLPRRRLRVLVSAAALVIIVGLHGRHMPAELSIRHLTLTMWPMTACRAPV
jgi:membrane-associated phospholipid phosphatase